MNARDIRAALSHHLAPEAVERLARHVDQLPDPGGALDALRRLAAIGSVPADPERLWDSLTLAGFSRYLSGVMVRNPDFLAALPTGDVARRLRTREDLEEELARFQFLNSWDDVSRVLRRFKQREYLRIALADFLGTADLPTVTRALSLLADVLLDKAVRLVRAPLEARHGKPTCRDQHGRLEEAEFVILALGKLGGEELNYSSDIDLIYLFSRDGETTGVGAEGTGVIANREFFTRLATEVTRLIEGGGPEGQVFRVDLDLRPAGRDGDLVMSVAAAVAYYHNWAEQWERQALVKARPVAGDLDLGNRLVRLIGPLLYEKTPDPYLTVDIASMKDRIDARLSARGFSERDIKLGWGGIREFEFAIQALQLQRGGADPWLRQGNTLLALHRLAEKGYVGFAEYSALGQAYVFLRDLEHRLQLSQNRQTSTLPAKPGELRILARSMRLGGDPDGGKEVERLGRHLQRHREVIRSFYDSVLGRSAQIEIGEEVPDIWLDRMDDDMILQRLASAGIEDPETVLGPVKTMRRLLQPVAVSRELRQALRRGGPLLLHAAVRSRHPRRALANLERLFSSLVTDPSDLERFLAHRELLAPTVQLLGRSSLFAGLLIRQPAILQALEDRTQVLKTPDSDAYRGWLVGTAPGAEGSARQGVGELRRRHQTALATTALRDINRQATLREVLKSLSDLADATLEAAAVLAREALRRREGAPTDEVRLAILGLGRLGYREIDYGSDLDLVFVQEGAEESPPRTRMWVTRLAEEIVRILSTLSRDGQLYKVDLRLRPSGAKGELVPSLSSLCNYLRTEADVWELQSFLKARPAAGDLDLGRRASEAIEREILERARTMDPKATADAVRDMRRRLTEAARSPDGSPSVKLGLGGILDIHFTIEYLQLRHGVGSPEDKDTLRSLTHLASLGLLETEVMQRLYEAYLFLRALDHEMRLIHDRPLPHIPADLARRQELASALNLEAKDDAAARLMDSFRTHTATVESIFEAVLRAP